MLRFKVKTLSIYYSVYINAIYSKKDLKQEIIYKEKDGVNNKYELQYIIPLTY